MTKNDDQSIPAPANGRNGKDHAESWSLIPHANVESLSLPELRTELKKAEDELAIAKQGGADTEFLQTWLVQDRRLILAELGRRERGLSGPEKPATVEAASFPEAAWSGLFRDWRDIVTPVTEASTEKLWSVLLIVAGLVLGRNAWLENPQKLFPNFYILLVGQTGRARKSTVLWLATELLRRVDQDVEIIRGIVSTEGIFERLKDKGTRALGYADELRAVLSANQRRGTSDILPKMNSLYSCPDSDAITRRDRDKSTEVEEPFFSFVTATPLRYVERLLGNEEIAGGVLNRYLIVCGKEQAPKPLVKSPSESAWQSIARPLSKIRDSWNKHPRMVGLDDDAVALWCEFYVGLYQADEEREEREVELTSRISDHVLKIALIYSVIFGEHKITAKALAIAIAIGRWLQSSTLNIFGNIGLDNLTMAEREILKLVEKRAWIYRRELQQLVSKKINGELFGRALKTLDANGFIKCHDGQKETPYGEFTGGQARPWVEYMRLTPNTYLRAQ